MINAKAQIGYDLKKIILNADTTTTKITLKNFPETEILSIEPESDFYDIKNGMFNSVTPNDLNILSQEAKQHIH